MLSVGVLCICDLWRSVCMCECRDGTGAQRVPPIRQTYCYYYQCTYCFCVESNDESSGEMTVNWELLVMILVCRCVRLLQSYWCGWLVDWW